MLTQRIRKRYYETLVTAVQLKSPPSLNRNSFSLKVTTTIHNSKQWCAQSFAKVEGGRYTDSSGFLLRGWLIHTSPYI